MMALPKYRKRDYQIKLTNASELTLLGSVLGGLVATLIIDLSSSMVVTLEMTKHHQHK